MQTVSKAKKGHYSSVSDPDPDVSRFKLHGYRILVRPLAPESKTKGGIILPDQFVDDLRYVCNVGKVLAMGDQCYNKKEDFGEEPWCKVGDYVTYPKLAQGSSVFELNGVPVVVINDSSVMMTLKSKEDVNSLFNLANY